MGNIIVTEFLLMLAITNLLISTQVFPKFHTHLSNCLVTDWHVLADVNVLAIIGHGRSWKC